MGWTPPALSSGIIVPAEVMGWRQQNEREDSDMNATTVAVDVAKIVFELAIADGAWWEAPGVRVINSNAGSTTMRSRS
jgi:hypothetical protein